MFALVVSCGLPEALHDLGHTLTQTNCETESQVARPTVSPETAQVAANETCWIQNLVSSIAQHSARSSQVSPVLQTGPALPEQLFAHEIEIASNDWIFWHTSRGPPAV